MLGRSSEKSKSCAVTNAGDIFLWNSTLQKRQESFSVHSILLLLLSRFFKSLLEKSLIYSLFSQGYLLFHQILEDHQCCGEVQQNRSPCSRQCRRSLKYFNHQHYFNVGNRSIKADIKVLKYRLVTGSSERFCSIKPYCLICGHQS